MSTCETSWEIFSHIHRLRARHQNWFFPFDNFPSSHCELFSLFSFLLIPSKLNAERRMAKKMIYWNIMRRSVVIVDIVFKDPKEALISIQRCVNAVERLLRFLLSFLRRVITVLETLFLFCRSDGDEKKVLKNREKWKWRKKITTRKREFSLQKPSCCSLARMLLVLRSLFSNMRAWRHDDDDELFLLLLPLSIEDSKFAEVALEDLLLLLLFKEFPLGERKKKFSCLHLKGEEKVFFFILSSLGSCWSLCTRCPVCIHPRRAAHVASAEKRAHEKFTDMTASRKNV